MPISKHLGILFCGCNFYKANRFLVQLRLLAWHDNNGHAVLSHSQSADNQLVNLFLSAKSAWNKKAALEGAKY